MTSFDWLYLASSPIVLPALAYRRLARGKYKESAAGMLGRGPQWAAPRAYAEGTTWLHAVSAGEVTAARAVAPELRKVFPQWPLVASTITETGQAAARRQLSEAAEVFYYPLDVSWIVARFLRRYRPRIVALMEAELWPNFLNQAADSGARVFLLNGRISERTFRRLTSFRRLMSGPISRIRAFCMQTEEDAERIRAILGRSEGVYVTGNCKFDAPFETLDAGERAAWRRRLGLDADQPALIAGSTHPGEEEIVLDAFAAARADIPQLALILAPRHPERFDAVAALLRDRGVAFRRCSDPQAGAERPQAVLLDTMGELARAYGLGEVAIVGGSFAPIGGHNLLEAAAHAVPVVYGPHMRRQPDILRLMRAAGGGVETEGESLPRTIRELFADAERRKALGLRARRALDENRGSARRMAEIMKDWAERGGEG